MAITRDAGYQLTAAQMGTNNWTPQLYSNKVLYKFQADTVFGDITNTD